jgi:uncharacterized membrane protein
MKPKHSRLIAIFVTGLLAALPLAATVLIFSWAVSVLLRWLGPDSAVGSVLVAVGLGSEAVGYLIGIGVVTLLIFGLGLMVEAGLQRGIASAAGSLLRRVPLVGTVYDLLHRMVGLFKPRAEDGLKSMGAVWCHFGGPGGAMALALLSTPEPVLIDGRRCLAVLVPTAPVPIGGGLLFVPEEWVTPANMGVEAVTSIYVSMGVTAPLYLGTDRRAVAGQA